MEFLYLEELYDENLVQINDDKISDELISSIQSFRPPSWDFLIKRDDLVGFNTEFYFCLAASMNGGFFYEDNGIKQWQINGSGSSAYLSWLEGLGFRSLLPGIDVFNLDENAVYFHHLELDKQPLSKIRKACIIELSSFENRKKFNALMDKIFGINGLNITFDHVKELASIYPKSFEEDPFLKKAQLVFCFIAGFYQDAYTVSNKNFIPADYQIPNILEYLGILTYSIEVKKELCSGRFLDVNSVIVNSIRYAAIKACRIIAEKANVDDYVVDGYLFTTYRKDFDFQLLKLPPMKCESLWF